jgi:hypothetical protein
MFGQGDAITAFVAPIHQAGTTIIKAGLAKKQQKFDLKEAKKMAEFRRSEAMKDMAIQARSSAVRGPSILPLVLAGVGTLVLLGGMAVIISRS